MNTCVLARYKALSVLLGAVALGTGLCLLAGCGTKPPPALWTWSASDSTKVIAAVSAWEAKLTTDFADVAESSEIVGNLPETTLQALHQDMRENPYKQRWFTKTFSRVFTVDSTIDSLTEVMDTTVEARLFEVMAGTATITTDSVTRFIEDTVISGMPFKLYDTLFSPVESTITVPVNAVCERELFLVPMAGDTIDKVHRTNWVVKRISGAGRYYSPDLADAPYIGVVPFVTNGGGRCDTFWLRPDTTHLGVQRLYSPDSLLTYAAGESIEVWLNPTWSSGLATFDGQLMWSPPDIAAFLHIGHERRNLLTGPLAFTSFAFTAADVGLQQIYIELVNRDPLTQADVDFSSCMWAIPINVVAAR